MQPLYAAIVLLMLTPTLAWASERNRMALAAARPQSLGERSALQLQREVGKRQQALTTMSNILRARSEINQTFARNIR